MSKLDAVIAILMVLWVMKLQLRIWNIQIVIEELLKIAHFHSGPYTEKPWPYVFTKESHNAETEVPPVYREDDVPASGYPGTLHGSSPAVGVEAEDTREHSSVQGSSDPGQGDN